MFLRRIFTTWGFSVGGASFLPFLRHQAGRSCSYSSRLSGFLAGSVSVLFCPRRHLAFPFSCFLAAGEGLEHSLLEGQDFSVSFLGSHRHSYFLLQKWDRDINSCCSGANCSSLTDLGPCSHPHSVSRACCVGCFCTWRQHQRIYFSLEKQRGKEIVYAIQNIIYT